MIDAVCEPIDAGADAGPGELAWLAIVAAARQHREVNLAASTIEEWTGLTATAVADAIEELCDMGRVSAWSADGEVYACATPAYAAAWGLEVTTRSTTDRGGPKGMKYQDAGAWKDRPDPSRDRPVKTSNFTSLRIDPALIVSPEPTADAMAEAYEEVAALMPAECRKLPDRHLARDPKRLPMPSEGMTYAGRRAWPDGWTDRCPVERGPGGYLVPVPLHRLDGWRVPPPRPKGRCPVCKGAKLPPMGYCLACDRFGLDWYLRRLEEQRKAEDRAKVIPARFGIARPKKRATAA